MHPLDKQTIADQPTPDVIPMNEAVKFQIGRHLFSCHHHGTHLQVSPLRHLNWSLPGSTAKQTCLGSLLCLELNLYCIMISSVFPLNSRRHHATHPIPANLVLDERFKPRSPTTLLTPSHIHSYAQLPLYLGCSLDTPQV